MPFLLWIIEIFPESQGPYEVTAIIHRLQELYSRKISRSAVYRAVDLLTERGDVAPRTPAAGSRPATYDFEAARRIARHVTHCRPPEQFFANIEKTPIKRLSKKTETQMGRKRDTNGTRRKSPLRLRSAK